MFGTMKFGCAASPWYSRSVRRFFRRREIRKVIDVGSKYFRSRRPWPFLRRTRTSDAPLAFGPSLLLRTSPSVSLY